MLGSSSARVIGTSTGVKSEVSSVTSGRTQGSPPSLSRESLLVITHAASGHQACLLPERDSPSDYIFECGCCCDPPCQLPCSCDCPGVGDEEEDDEEEEEEEDEGCSIEGTVFGDGDCSLNGSLPRSLSMPIKEHATKEGAGDTQSPQNNNNIKRGSVRSKVSSRRPSFHTTTAATNTTATNTTTVSFIQCNQTLPRAAKRGSGGVREVDLAGLPTCHEARLEEQRASSCGLDTVAGLLDGAAGGYMGDVGLAGGVSNDMLDETYRTRSLPAWVRNKTRPLALLDDLNTIYEKPQWSKRRRNRMRSDAATVIALSKSRARLMSTGASSSGGGGGGGGSGSEQGGTNAGTPEGVRTPAGQAEATTGGAAVAVVAAPQQPDTAVLVENEAVIVYDERTAL
ncbi:hypothetical protein Pcinc_039596 [Petrolisthes cinctipes]|uniref:Uncharacterized protein n=1 Tax=Petrolisthes cinctipes TaxID=88211 RepID=A0AAE1BNN0_PETCI|nr:hypothetical protein Pcinc_039596 [Petrolisthes cinctipes]